MDNINLTDEQLIEFLKRIGYTEDRAKELLNSKLMKEKYIPQFYIFYRDLLYKELLDDAKHR